MRLTDLFEAPIADFGYHDWSGDNGSSFEPDDQRALQNPKWQAKLVKTFSKTIEPINFYALNAKRFSVPLPHTGEKRSVTVTPQLIDMGTWSGTYSPEEFQQTFHFIPPHHERAINILFVQNYGDDRVPLTPWMVAHRIIHAFISQERRNLGRADFQWSGHDAWTEAQNMMGAIRDVWDRDRDINDVVSGDYSELYATIATFASARNHKIIRSGEFIIEMMTQYFLTGELRLNIEALSPDRSDREVIDYRRRKMIAALDDTFSQAVGHLIVF